MKRGLVIAYIVIVLLVFTLSISITQASLTCTVGTAASCSDTHILYFQNDTGGWDNAHAQLASVATYSNSLCCVDGEDAILTTCVDEAFLGVLSDTDDAHFEEYGIGNYATNACLSATTNRYICSYEVDCASYDTCLFSYASSEGDNTTNAHVGDCSEYANKVCCTLNHKPTISQNFLNATSIYNYTTDNLTVHMITSDSDGDNITNITDWRIDGVSFAAMNVPMDTNYSATTTDLIKDYSTTARHGTLGAGNSSHVPSWVSNGQVGGAYNFTNSDFIEFGLTAGSYDSLSIWFKTTSVYEDIIAAEFLCAYSVVMKHGKIVASLNGDADDVQTVNTFNDGNWHHLAVVKSGEAYPNNVYFYVDGVLQTNEEGQSYRVGGRMLLGARYYQSSYEYFFDGLLDEFSVYEHSLSQEQVTQLYQDGLAKKHLETIASQETTAGENWTVQVTPNDGWQDGDELLSNGVIILEASLPVVVENTFVNSSTTHSFNVTGGVSYTNGGNLIDSVSISSSQGTCVNVANSTNGIYFNATYTCSGTPYVASDIELTFCTTTEICNSTQTTTNSYPNQAPNMGTLLTPTDGNDTLIQRNVSFTWSTGTDIEGDDINYSINVTNGYCPNFITHNITTTNYVHPDELRTAYECQNNEYYWQVRACDAWDCGSYTTLWNFTIQDYLEITITNDEMNFSLLSLLDEDDTTDNDPLPFTFENTGNINANLTNVNSTGLWTVANLDTDYYQFKVDNATEQPSFDWMNSATNWLNITDTGYSNHLVGNLNYSLTNNDVAVEIRLVVPPGEPPGAKTNTLEFVWEAAE